MFKKIKISFTYYGGADTKEEATSSDTHGGEFGDKKTSQVGKAFKKKNSKCSYTDKKNEGVPELNERSRL